MRHLLPIERDFRGGVLPAAHRAQIGVQRAADALIVELDAPYFGDPAPPGRAGPTDRLWEYEVAELFIADAGDRYLEIELSPHGHHLVLELHGVRRVVRAQLPIAYTVQIDRVQLPAHPELLGRYRGEARIPLEYLPAAPTRGNAYLIHGVAANRCYCAHNPPLGETPDFHRLESFVTLRL
jgi:hypothetical protein